jgi:hypothetical protein
VSAGAGRRIVQASWAGTALLAVATGLALFVGAAEVPATVIDLLLFLGGAVVFLWAYAIAVGRSRSVEIGIGGLYFVQGTAPAAVRRQLLGSLAAEVIIAGAAASLRPFSSFAFTILAPLWGLGLTGLWGARHGTFQARRDGVGRT